MRGAVFRSLGPRPRRRRARAPACATRSPAAASGLPRRNRVESILASDSNCWRRYCRLRLASAQRLGGRPLCSSVRSARAARPHLWLNSFSAEYPCAEILSSPRQPRSERLACFLAMPANRLRTPLDLEIEAARRESRYRSDHADRIFGEADVGIADRSDDASGAFLDAAAKSDIEKVAMSVGPIALVRVSHGGTRLLRLCQMCFFVINESSRPRACSESAPAAPSPRFPSRQRRPGAEFATLSITLLLSELDLRERKLRPMIHQQVPNASLDLIMDLGRADVEFFRMAATSAKSRQPPPDEVMACPPCRHRGTKPSSHPDLCRVRGSGAPVPRHDPPLGSPSRRHVPKASRSY